MSIREERKAMRPSEWREAVSEYESSGLSVKEYCAERGINVYTFKGWQQELKNAASQQFREVAVPASADASYTIRLRSGNELRIEGSFSAARVKHLIEILLAC